HDRAAFKEGGIRRPLALAYFALIGLAFITVEIALLQKFTLFLGHPSYSLLVVLFSLLVATAIGARGSARFRTGKAALMSALALGVLIFIYAGALGPLLRAWVAWPIAVRIPVAGLLVGLCGLPMGIMLPTGLRLLGDRDAVLVPWCWGM